MPAGRVPAPSPVMRPVYINGCLGWLHQAPGPTRNLGVVLCPALGREARWAYRAMRYLADRLAARGLVSLRLEYPGTGESAEPSDWEQPIAAWRNSVHDAADWLRAQSGVDHLALVGLRFGALLAAEAAAGRSDVTAVALLAPVLSGRSCVRELRLAAVGGAGDAQAENGIELDGISLPEASLAEIGRSDLLTATRAPAASILLLGEDQTTARYASRLRDLGVQADQRPFSGYDQLMRVATSNQIPHAALAGVAEWIGRLAMPQPLTTSTAARAMLGDPVLERAGWCERPIQFGRERTLVGVLCVPSGTAAATQAMLIVNTGGDPRAGIGRFAVRLARHSACTGVATLRFDLAGLGDSRMVGDADPHLYETDRLQDIADAIDVLEAQGYREIGGIGLCTGAYHLLHAVPKRARLQALVLINLVTFQWRTGDRLEVAQRALGHSNGYYRSLARHPKTWLRALRGGVDLRHVIRTLICRTSSQLLRRAAGWLGRAGVQTKLDLPRRQLQALGRDGTSLLMIYGADDPGMAQLEANFGRNGRMLATVPGVRVAIESGIDHTLSRCDMQDRVAAIIARFLTAIRRSGDA